MPRRTDRKSEFDAQVRRRLADRAGHQCSICGTHTTGPSDDPTRVVNNVGVAAHVRGARPGSCRYDSAMSSDERSSIDNGIWLCQVCAKRIDNDAITWSLPKLFAAKFAAEQRAKDRLGKGRRRRKCVQISVEGWGYFERFQAVFVCVKVVNEEPRAITVERASLLVGGRSHDASEPIASVSIGGRRQLDGPPLRLSGQDAVHGAWAFQGFSNSPWEECSEVELVTKVVGQRAKRHVLARYSAAPSLHREDDGSIR
jgi:hypothetical protein